MNYCKDCVYHWTKGTNPHWCCKQGKPCNKAVSHCILKQYKKVLP